MEKSKITKAMVLAAIKEADLTKVDFGAEVTAEDVVAYAEVTLAQLAAKAAKAKEKAAEKKAAADELQEKVASVLTDELQSAEDIAAQIEGEDITKGKVVNRLSKLIEAGVAVKEAVKAMQAKIFENMNPDEIIASFIDKFEKGKKYPGTEFFEWHHYLTGSCLMGRESFVKRHELNLEDEITVDEFIALCENDYGSEIIKQLKKQWQN